MVRLPHTHDRAGRRRRTTVVALGVLALGVLALIRPLAGVSFNPGKGWSYATVVSVGPEAAQLSFAVDFGVAVTDYRGSVARAESRAADLGLIGTGLQGKGCDGSDPMFPKDQFPQPLKTDSTQEGSEEGQVATYSGTPPDSPFDAAFAKQQVWASPTPTGHAVSDLAVFGVPGVLEVAGGRAESEAGIPEAATRSASAQVAVPRVALGGGAIVLEDLRWNAEHRSGDTGTGDGVASFSIGRVLAGGQAFPGPDSPSQVATFFDQVNTALASTGLVMRPPTTQQDGSAVRVTPLVIGVERSALGGQIFSAPLGAAQPIREEFTRRMIEGDCRFGTGILVGDILLGVPAGSGSFTVALGGVYATTGAGSFDPLPPLFQPPRPPALAVLGEQVEAPWADSAPVADRASPPAAPADAVALGPGSTGPVKAPSLVSGGGDRGRGAGAVLLGLLGVLAVVAADGWRIRRARAVSSE